MYVSEWSVFELLSFWHSLKYPSCYPTDGVTILLRFRKFWLSCHAVRVTSSRPWILNRIAPCELGSVLVPNYGTCTSSWWKDFPINVRYLPVFSRVHIRTGNTSGTSLRGCSFRAPLLSFTIVLVGALPNCWIECWFYLISTNLFNSNIYSGGMGRRWTNYGESLSVLGRGTRIVDCREAVAAYGEAHEAEGNRCVLHSSSAHVRPMARHSSRTAYGSWTIKHEIHTVEFYVNWVLIYYLDWYFKVETETKTTRFYLGQHIRVIMKFYIYYFTN